jgi:hypothetical protein
MAGASTRSEQQQPKAQRLLDLNQYDKLFVFRTFLLKG